MEISKVFGTRAGDEEYVAELDLNMDGAINLFDIAIVIRHFNALPSAINSAINPLLLMNIGCKKAVVVKAAAFLFGLLCVLKTQLFKIKFLL